MKNFGDFGIFCKIMLKFWRKNNHTNLVAMRCILNLIELGENSGLSKL